MVGFYYFLGGFREDEKISFELNGVKHEAKAELLEFDH